MTMLVRGGAVTGSALPTGATTGQVLSWNGSAWVAATPSATGITPNATPTVPGLVQLAGDLAGTATAPTVAKINGSAPAAVATSGAYTDLTGRPALAAVATSGAYTDLTGRPALAAVATSGAYTDLTGRPALAAVATSGSYGDLTSRPLLAPVATSGSYTDLTGAPSVPATQTAYKASSSAVTSSTTKSADPALQFASVAAGTYLLEVEGNAVSGSSGVNFAWNVTGSASFTAPNAGMQITALGSTVNLTLPVATTGLIITLNAATAMPFRVAVPLTVSAAGSLAFSWAQGTSNAAALTLNAGAWARLTKVA